MSRIHSIDERILWRVPLSRLIGPVAIGVLIKYKWEKGAAYLQKITTPFTVFVLLFNLTVGNNVIVTILFLSTYNSI